jgi:sugar phosphate isomerase/epimerase
MNSPLTRRDFLTATAASAGAIALHATAPSLASAIEPFKRTAPPTYKFSLAAYSYRDLLMGNKKYVDQAWKIEDFIDECAKMPLEGTELTSYYFAKNITPEYLNSLKRHAFLRGLDISGTAVRNDFCLPKGAKRDEEITAMKQWVDYAETLGAPVIRIFAGHVGEKQSDADAHRLMVDGISQCCDYAGKHGVILALENHGGPTSTAKGLLKIVRDINSPWFGINFDSGNFHDTDDVYAEMAEIAPYSVNAQIKASIKPADKKTRPTDYNRVAKILKDAGYRGYIVLEFEDAEDPRVACPRELKKLREAFA